MKKGLPSARTAGILQPVSLRSLSFKATVSVSCMLIRAPGDFGRKLRETSLMYLGAPPPKGTSKAQSLRYEGSLWSPFGQPKKDEGRGKHG